MFYIKSESQSEVTVVGPNHFQKTIPTDAIGIVWRTGKDGVPEEFVVRVAEMTDAEIVGQAIDLPAYPADFEPSAF